MFQVYHHQNSLHSRWSVLWEPPTRQFYPYFPAFEPPAAYPITVGQTSAKPPLASTRLYCSDKNGASVAPSVSGSSSTTRTTNKWDPACIEKLQVSASLLVPPTASTFTSQPTRRTGPISSFPAQPSRRASPALPSSNGLHSVQYSDSLHLTHTSYKQRPFQGLPRTFGVWRA
jgi:hypothetical protein